MPQNNTKEKSTNKVYKLLHNTISALRLVLDFILVLKSILELFLR